MIHKYTFLLVVVFLGLLNLTTARIPPDDVDKAPQKETLGYQINPANIPPHEIDAILVNLVSTLNSQTQSPRHKDKQTASYPSIDMAATEAGYFKAKMSAEPMFVHARVYIIRAAFAGIVCGKQKTSCRRGGTWRMSTDMVGKVYQGGCYGSRCCGGVQGSCFDKEEQKDDFDKYLPDRHRHGGWEDCDSHHRKV